MPSNETPRPEWSLLPNYQEKIRRGFYVGSIPHIGLFHAEKNLAFGRVKQLAEGESWNIQNYTVYIFAAKGSQELLLGQKEENVRLEQGNVLVIGPNTRISRSTIDTLGQNDMYVVLHRPQIPDVSFDKYLADYNDTFAVVNPQEYKGGYIVGPFVQSENGLMKSSEIALGIVTLDDNKMESNPHTHRDQTEYDIVVGEYSMRIKNNEGLHMYYKLRSGNIVIIDPGERVGTQNVAITSKPTNVLVVHTPFTPGDKKPWNPQTA